jgi:hypothetical protein
MAILVTENWQQARKSLREPWTAYREYTVTGADSEDAALTATGIPQRNHALSAGSRLRCEGPDIRERSTGRYVVGCNFVIPPTGAFQVTPPDATDPLLDPLVYTCEEMELSEAVDRDLDGRPYLYSNGQPLGGGVQTISLLVYQFRKNYPFWNPQWHRDYANSTNSDPVSLGGIWYPQQHLYVRSVKPVGEIRADATYVPVVWTIVEVPGGVLGSWPWQARFMDQGESGWWADGETKRLAKFSNGKGELLGEVVRLDGTGKPRDSSVKVGETNATPVSPATVPSYYQLETANNATWLVFKKTKLANFSQIPL